MLRETKAANEELKKMREAQHQKEMAEEKKIEEYGRKKQAMIDLRKRREAERFREKQAARQRLIDKQVARLRQMKDEEDTRISNQIVEARKKNEAMLAKREEKRVALKAEMDHFSNIYRTKKVNEAATQKSKDKKYQEFWIGYNKQLVRDLEVAYFNRKNKKTRPRPATSSAARICTRSTCSKPWRRRRRWRSSSSKR